MPRHLAPRSALVLAAVVGVIGIAGAPRPAAADSPADPDAARLDKVGGVFKSTVTLAGKTDHVGHAEVLINAPSSRVLSVVTDYAHYKDIVPHKLKNVHVVAKDQASTDVRFEVPIMHGAVKIWYKLRFGPAVTLPTGEKVVEGKYIDGNVKSADLVFTVRQVAPAFTVLKIDNFIDLKVPAPQAMIDEELRDAAGDAAGGMHDRAQGSSTTVPYDAALKPRS